MDAPLSNPYAKQEQALLDWQMRLEARERDLNILQRHLIDWGTCLTKMAQVLGELDALQRGVPVAAAQGDRPQLRLVPPVREKEPS